MRTRTVAAIDAFMRRHPDRLQVNARRMSRRLKVAPSGANKPWPVHVLRYADKAPVLRKAQVVGKAANVLANPDSQKDSRADGRPGAV